MKTAEPETTFWANNHPLMPVYDRLYAALVPASGPATTPHGELLRAVSSLYYDTYNNGGGNIRDGALDGHVEVVRRFAAQYVMHCPAGARRLMEGTGLNGEKVINDFVAAVVQWVADLDRAWKGGDA